VSAIVLLSLRRVAGVATRAGVSREPRENQIARASRRASRGRPRGRPEPSSVDLSGRALLQAEEADALPSSIHWTRPCGRAVEPDAHVDRPRMRARGPVRPMTFAARRLTTSSLVGCSMGESPGWRHARLHRICSPRGPSDRATSAFTR